MQPTFYINHGGGPCFFLEPGPTRDTWAGLETYLRGFADHVAERPQAILAVSGHWEEPVPTVNAGAHPPLLFDYAGFPEHTYRLTWPAPGAPAIAARVRELLAEAGMSSGSDATRGWDHGVFVPLKVAYPDADVPVVQLSLQRGLDPAAHLAIGRALRPLRAEGMLILGSGQSYHNMRGFFDGDAEDPRAEAFDAWLREAVIDPDRRDAALAEWAGVPGARLAHPREEHLLPLMVAAGAAWASPPPFTSTAASRASRSPAFGLADPLKENIHDSASRRRDQPARRPVDLAPADERAGRRENCRSTKSEAAVGFQMPPEARRPRWHSTHRR